MTHRDAINIPLSVAALATPSWITELQNFWAIILPVAGGILLILQILYYWKMLRGK